VFVKGLYELLTQDPGVSALVGNRVYFILQPKGTSVPSVVMSCITTTDLYVMAGNTGKRDGLWQIDCYAVDYYSANAVQLAVRSVLENFIGNLPDADATPVIATFIEKCWDMPYEPGAKGFIYRTMLEVRFHYYDTSLPINTPASGNTALVDGGISTTDDSQ